MAECGGWVRWKLLVPSPPLGRKVTPWTATLSPKILFVFFSVEKYFSGSWISGDEKVGHTFFCVDEPRKRQQPAAVPQSFCWQQRPEENQQKLETKHRKLSNLKRIGLPPDSSIVSSSSDESTFIGWWSKDETVSPINQRHLIQGFDVCYD